MEKSIASVLLSQTQLQDRICELAGEISREYAGKDPVFIGVLKGVTLFFSDFIKQVSVPCEMDFMSVSSYSGRQSTGRYTLRMDISMDIRDRHVVILEDVFDTGRTLDFIWHHLMERKPASLKIVTLLDKPSQRDPSVTVRADLVGFEIGNDFVVGYGLDFNEKFRNLPYIGVLKPEAYL